MNSRRRQAGYTLMEQMVGALVAVVIGAGLFRLFGATLDSQYLVLRQNNSEAAAREAVDTLVDKGRGAAGLLAAGPTDVTWMDNSGNTIRYWLSGGALVRTVNSLPAGGKVLLSGVQSLSFNYGTWNGSTWQYSTTPSIPTTVGTFDITVTASIGGVSRAISGSVRLRQQRCKISGTTKVF